MLFNYPILLNKSHDYYIHSSILLSKITHIFLETVLKHYLLMRGLISQEKLQLFNFPLYYPTPKEFERNGLFSIESTNILAYAAMEKTFCAEDST